MKINNIVENISMILAIFDNYSPKLFLILINFVIRKTNSINPNN